MDDKITNIVVVGTGGQGIMTAAEILTEVAIDEGFDVKKTEVAGMSQRGGVVTSHVRFGPKILSPVVVEGEADILLAFEAAEGMRWVNYLRPTGVAMINTMRLTPPVVSVGLFDYPKDPVQEIIDAGVETHAFDAGKIATDLGNFRLVNTVMLGAVADYLPFSAEIVKDKVVDRFRARKPQMVAVNEQAFDLGRAAAGGNKAEMAV